MAKDVEKIANKYNDEIDSLIADSEKTIDGEISNLNSYISGYVGSLNESSDPAQGQIELNDVLIASGFFAVMSELLNEGYQQAADNALALNGVLHDRVFALPEDAIAKLNSFKQIDFDTIRSEVDTYLQSVNRAANGVRFGAVNPNDVIAQIEKKFGQTLNGRVKTLINTGISGAHNTTIIESAKAEGIERFLYSGPRDNRNRPFCSRYIGQVKTLEQWDDLNDEQGQIAPVSVYRGGYNCRHILVAVA